MSDPLNVVVVGAGGRGRYLARSFAADPRTRLVGLCDVADGPIRIARREFGDSIRYYATQAEMIVKEDFQVGVVASSDHAHAEHAIAFLRGDAHVYLEKPMAMTIADCDAILRAWAESTGTLLVGLELRYCTLCEEMKRLLDAGEIGSVKLGMAVDNVSVGGQYYYHGPRRRKAFIKSLMLEKGTHTLDLMNWFIGSAPVRVFGEGALDVFGGQESEDKHCRDCADRDTCPYFIDSERFVMDYGEAVRKADGCVWAAGADVDDNAVITVRYANGAKMTYTECHFTPDYNRHFTLIGDAGRLYGFYNNEQEFVIRLQKRHERVIREIHPPRAGGGHGGGDPQILEQFVALARAGKHACPGGLDARNSAAIAIAAAESCETHMPVTIPPAVLDERPVGPGSSAP